MKKNILISFSSVIILSFLIVSVGRSEEVNYKDFNKVIKTKNDLISECKNKIYFNINNYKTHKSSVKLKNKYQNKLKECERV